MSSTTSSQTLLLRQCVRRRLSSPQAPRTAPLPSCYPFPPSLAALDLSTSSPAPVLASVRLLVLSHLAELEGCLSHSDFPTKESLKSKGEEAVEDVRVWAMEGLEMLRNIRSDVCSHLPDLPFDPAHMEEVLMTHLPDFSYPAIMDDIRSHLPDLPRLRSRMSEFDLTGVQTRMQDVCSHFPDMPVDFNQPLKYLPTLSHHLQSLHAHLSSMKTDAGYQLPSLPPTNVLSELLDKLLSSDLVPSVLHRSNGHESSLEKAAREVSDALKKSLDGSRLVTYVDLPFEWRNNPFVVRGYRFIPLHRWPHIILSLFTIHNETLNIHTHMIPMLHSALCIIPSLNYSSVPLDRPETVSTVFSVMCLFCSAVWHTMSGCAHRAGMELCARVDYVGIGWHISTTVGTVVYYGFSCHSQAAVIYLSLCVLMAVLGSIFPFMKWFNDRKYKYWRVAFFLGMAFAGLAPLAHLSYYFGFWQVVSFIAPIAPSLAYYLIGLTFYVTHIPERFAHRSARLSRWTDWLGGGSHAIWHIFIVLAMYQHRGGMRELRAGVSGQGCLL